MATIKKVALTFDDGPNPPYTEQILNILKKESVRACFFVCGANAERHPETVKRIASEGHLVGNHTWNHRYLPTLSGTVYKETLETQALIEKVTGQKLKLFRAPWLISPFWLNNRLEREGFKIIGSGIFGDDWKGGITPEEIKEKILSSVRNRSIIILHDGFNAKGGDRSKTVKATSLIIRELKKKKYEFVKPAEIE